jgi:hypothetical protein
MCKTRANARGRLKKFADLQNFMILLKISRKKMSYLIFAKYFAALEMFERLSQKYREISFSTTYEISYFRDNGKGIFVEKPNGKWIMHNFY